MIEILNTPVGLVLIVSLSWGAASLIGVLFDEIMWKIDTWRYNRRSIFCSSEGFTNLSQIFRKPLKF